MWRLPICGRLEISGSGSYQPLVDRFRRARSDETLAVLEGFHPLKHALRFGASIVEVITHDPEKLSALAGSLAPDLADFPGTDALVVPSQVFRQLSPVPPSTGVMAIAKRPQIGPHAFAHTGAAPLVYLENPRSHGNIGAVVRVAAAAGAAGVITSGDQDPWHPSALVGSAGLHFALPVSWPPSIDFGKPPPWLTGRKLVAVDPEGNPLGKEGIPSAAVLAFGTEREGLSRKLLSAAQSRIAIPMQPGVSSLNLATAVAVVLYAWRLG